MYSSTVSSHSRCTQPEAWKPACTIVHTSGLGAFAGLANGERAPSWPL